MEENRCCTRICVGGVAMALGIAFGLCMLLSAWAAWQWGHGMKLIDLYSSVYYGYDATFIGGLWGLLWGFIDGFVMGLVFGFIYNLIACCCNCWKNCRTCMPTKKSKVR